MFTASMTMIQIMTKCSYTVSVPEGHREEQYSALLGAILSLLGI